MPTEYIPVFVAPARKLAQPRKVVSRIVFPMWVKSATPCKTRSFSVTIPDADQHGAIRLEHSFPNRPVVKLHRIGRPGFYVGWLDKQTVETRVYR